MNQLETEIRERLERLRIGESHINVRGGEVRIRIPKYYSVDHRLFDGLEVVEVTTEGDKLLIRLRDSLQKLKGYCKRTKELVLEANPGYETWEKSPYKVIDFPLEKTVAILFPKRRPDGVLGISPHRLAKHGAEIRLVKPVKNGTIIAYHFNN